MSKTVLFPSIQFNISTLVQCQKTDPFQTIQFSVSTHFSSILPIDRALSGSWSDGNEEVLCIAQISSITGNSQAYSLASLQGHSLEVGSYPSAEKQSVYSTAPADWEVAYLYISKCLYLIQIVFLQVFGFK